MKKPYLALFLFSCTASAFILVPTCMKYSKNLNQVKSVSVETENAITLRNVKEKLQAKYTTMYGAAFKERSILMSDLREIVIPPEILFDDEFLNSTKLSAGVEKSVVELCTLYALIDSNPNASTFDLKLLGGNADSDILVVQGREEIMFRASKYSTELLGPFRLLSSY